MRQRSIAKVIDRLVENDELRDAFLTEPHRALFDLLERDAQLTNSEMSALTALDATFWEQIAERIEPAYRHAA